MFGSYRDWRIRKTLEKVNLDSGKLLDREQAKNFLSRQAGLNKNIMESMVLSRDPRVRPKKLGGLYSQTRKYVRYHDKLCKKGESRLSGDFSYILGRVSFELTEPEELHFSGYVPVPVFRMHF